MSTPSQLGSWDLFFNYGKNSLDLENESDAMMILVQGNRTLFYNNLESGGVSGSENHPNVVSLQVSLRYGIASAFAFRNRMVVDGSNGNKDRRLAVSQNSINFISNRNGELDVAVLYIPYFNYDAYKTINPSVPGVV
jgi:hypothetical protein